MEIRNVTEIEKTKIRTEMPIEQKSSFEDFQTALHKAMIRNGVRICDISESNTAPNNPWEK